VPGAKARKIEEPRSMIDLAPTILEMFSVESDPLFHGTSLVPELLGGDAKPRDVMVDLARTSDNDKRRALVRGNYKIYEFGDADGFELYDVVKDPGEEDNLARKDKTKFEEMKKAILDADKTVKEICPKFTDKLKGKKKNKPC
jgi:arylsulfatase A-like enzyme